MNTGLSVPVDRRRFGSGRRCSRPSKYGRALRFPFTSRWMLSSASLWTVTTSSSRIIHSRCPFTVNVCAGAAVFTPTDPRRLSRRFSGDQRLRYLHSVFCFRKCQQSRKHFYDNIGRMNKHFQFPNRPSFNSMNLNSFQFILSNVGQFTTKFSFILYWMIAHSMLYTLAFGSVLNGWSVWPQTHENERESQRPLRRHDAFRHLAAKPSLW